MSIISRSSTHVHYMYSVLYMILGVTDERINDVIYMISYQPCMGDLNEKSCMRDCMEDSMGADRNLCHSLI